MDVFHGETLCWITKRFSVMSGFSINTPAATGIDPDHGAGIFFKTSCTGVFPEVKRAFFVYSLEHKEAHI
jgi:hypothetical protein